jgi:hypothetical protein
MASCLRRVLTSAAAAGVLGASPALAQDVAAPAVSAERPIVLRWSLKATGLFTGAPNEAGVAAGSATATGFWRFRVEPTWRMSARVSMEAAYEHRARAFSSTDAAGAAMLPSEAAAPYRVRPLDWTLRSGAHGAWRHEIDRAALRVGFSRIDLRVGRQAVGWGRGLFFGAIDLFAPFSPLEADREWRRGVDAVRADMTLSTRASVDVVAAIGRDAETSAVAGRLRGYAKEADVEVAAGRRAGDVFLGAASSAVVGPAEIHGEVAAFRGAARPGAPARTVAKAVIGGSSRLGVGAGVLLAVEYHYSGFGADGAGRIAEALADPAFVERYLRGDMQILTRHALAATTAYEVSPLVSCTVAWIQQPVDRSGVVVPSISLTFGDRASAGASAYWSYGRGRSLQGLGSEYGATPISLLVQVRFYR